MIQIPPQSAWNVRVLMEPRGFIRIIQLFVAILAFSCASDGGSQGTLEFQCTKTKDNEIMTPWQHTYQYSYPYNLVSTKTKLMPKMVCPPLDTAHPKTYFSGLQSKSSSSQFFVFCGVWSFLTCLALCALYVIFAELYETNTMVPTVDLIHTAVLSFFWFIGAISFAAAITGIKEQTTNSAVMELNSQCASGVVNGDYTVKCSGIKQPYYGSIIVADVFGFLCFFLWTASLWFIYKETHWHKGAASSSEFSGAATSGTGLPSSNSGQPPAAAGQAGMPPSQSFDQPPLAP